MRFDKQHKKCSSNKIRLLVLLCLLPMPKQFKMRSQRFCLFYSAPMLRLSILPIIKKRPIIMLAFFFPWWWWWWVFFSQNAGAPQFGINKRYVAHSMVRSRVPKCGINTLLHSQRISLESHSSARVASRTQRIPLTILACAFFHTHHTLHDLCMCVCTRRAQKWQRFISDPAHVDDKKEQQTLCLFIFGHALSIDYYFLILLARACVDMFVHALKSARSHFPHFFFFSRSLEFL